MILTIYLGRLTRILKFPSQYLLEAKVHTYKIYDKSILSLIQENGWVSDEVINNVMDMLCTLFIHAFILNK